MTTKEVKIDGTIVKLFQKEQITDSFAKREVWVKESEGDYPNTFNVEFHQDNCSKLDAVKEGDDVSIKINLRGKQWKSKDGSKEGCSNNLVGWKIEKIGSATPSNSMNDDDLPDFLK